MQQLKTYRFKLNPTSAQEQSFAQWWTQMLTPVAGPGTCRYVYNLCLDYKKQLYTHHSISIGKNEIQKELSAIAKETVWIGQLHSQTLQDVTDRLFKSYDGFFKQGKGFPKFAKRDFYRSFTFKQGVKLHENTSRIALPKIGKVKYRKSQIVDGQIKTANISKQADGWYISISCEAEIKPLPANSNSVGIDVGIKYFLVSSDEKPPVENPKYLYKYQYQLRKAQRAVSRKRKGGSNRKKVVTKLAKVHLKIRNTRKDFQHQLSTRLIRENQTIVVENLQVSNLLKNHKLAKSIADCGWYQFVSMLAYKAKWYGRYFVKVAPHYTSQDCNVCGNRNSELTLAEREWTCNNCNNTHCRDTNAAKNIRNRGLDISLSAWKVYKPVGVVVQESPCL